MCVCDLLSIVNPRERKMKIKTGIIQEKTNIRRNTKFKRKKKHKNIQTQWFKLSIKLHTHKKRKKKGKKNTRKD